MYSRDLSQTRQPCLSRASPYLMRRCEAIQEICTRPACWDFGSAPVMRRWRADRAGRSIRYCGLDASLAVLGTFRARDVRLGLVVWFCAGWPAGSLFLVVRARCVTNNLTSACTAAGIAYTGGMEKRYDDAAWDSLAEVEGVVEEGWAGCLRRGELVVLKALADALAGWYVLSR